MQQLAIALTAVLVVSATVLVHARGTYFLTRHLSRDFTDAKGLFTRRKALLALIWSATALLLLHVIEIHLWALTYLFIEPVDELTTFESDSYFSFVTFTCGSRKREHVDSIAHSRVMVDPVLHDPVDSVHSETVDDVRPIAAFFVNGECGAAAPVVRVPAFGTKAAYPTGRSAALVRHVEAVVGVAHRPVLCPAQDCSGLAEKAIPRLLARAQSVE